MTEDKGSHWASYARFTLVDGKPTTWLEISGDQNKLIKNLAPGQGVFGIEIRVPKPRTGTVMP